MPQAKAKSVIEGSDKNRNLCTRHRAMIDCFGTILIKFLPLLQSSNGRHSSIDGNNLCLRMCSQVTATTTIFFTNIHCTKENSKFFQIQSQCSDYIIDFKLFFLIIYKTKYLVATDNNQSFNIVLLI